MPNGYEWFLPPCCNNTWYIKNHYLWKLVSFTSICAPWGTKTTLLFFFKSSSMEDSIWHTELSLITMITLFNYASWFTLFLKKKKKIKLGTIIHFILLLRTQVQRSIMKFLSDTARNREKFKPQPSFIEHISLLLSTKKKWMKESMSEWMSACVKIKHYAGAAPLLRGPQNLT